VQLSIKRGFGRYTALVVGLGAAGLAIGWIGPNITAVLIADRSQWAGSRDLLGKSLRPQPPALQNSQQDGAIAYALSAGRSGP
jgi:hypothetical protein